METPPTYTHDEPSLISQFFQQLRRNLWAVLLVYGFCAVVLGIVWDKGHKPNGKIIIEKFLRDPAQTAGLPFYTGIVSNMGVLFWSAAAGICLLAYAVLRRMAPAAKDFHRFFLMSGILTVLWVTDDLFMIHEEVVPEVIFHKRSFLHIKEGAVLIAYALYTLLFLWMCRKTILKKTDWALLALALCGLFGSILADKGGLKYLVPVKTTRGFIEDGAKFIGILGWTLYFAHTAWQVIVAEARQVSRPTADKLES